MADTQKSSLQALLQSVALPDLPPVTGDWKRDYPQETIWKRKLVDYLRRLLQNLTGTNIVTEIIQQTNFNDYPSDFGLNAEFWLEYAWPSSENTLYGTGASFSETDFDDAPLDFPTEKPFWSGSVPNLNIEGTENPKMFPGWRFENRLSQWFAARFTGYIIPLYAETYTITVVSDNGVRLWLDDVLKIDDWVCAPGGRTNTTTFVGVVGTKVKLKVEWFNAQSDGNIKMNWTSTSQGDEVVPYHQLSRVLRV